MEKTILLMRHAEAGEGVAGSHDFDRELVDDGCEMARQTAACVNLLGIQISRIVASSARRTQQTAEIVAAEMARDRKCPQIPLVLVDTLYNASAETLVRTIREEAFDEDNTILAVGHNPGIASLMSLWATQGLQILPATLTVFQLQTPAWADVPSGSAGALRYVAMIQEGRIVWKASAFGPFESSSG